jgi:hypothetical protein
MRYRGHNIEQRRHLIRWQQRAELCLQSDGSNLIERGNSDLGYRYQIALSQLAQSLGLAELCRYQETIVPVQPRHASEIVIPSEPYFLRLSPDTLYFHNALDAYFLFLDCLFLDRWQPLHIKNVIIHPAMTVPETKALGLLATIEWICIDRGISLFVVTLAPECFKYLHRPQFIPSCENFMHRSRCEDYTFAQSQEKFDTFMAWDAGWSPESKGLPLVLEAFRELHIQNPLVIKIPDSYPNKSVEARSFFDLIDRYQDYIDVRLVSIPGGRERLLETIWNSVEILIHAGRSDVGPRIVFEAMGMNKKILFFENNDCYLLRFPMLKGISGFRTFNKRTLGIMLDELEREESKTASFFDRFNWHKTRELFRERTGDPSIHGFWMECSLMLDPGDG